MTTGLAREALGEPRRDQGDLRLDHRIAFSLQVRLAEDAAREFVRDAPRSLRHADFLTDLTVAGEPPVVSAALQVSVAIFGRRSLPFQSRLEVTPLGARLSPLPCATDGAGWVELTGEGRAFGDGPGRSRLEYDFALAVNLATPSSERWGTQALLKMIELTAASVLKRLIERFPRAIELAAQDAAPGQAGR